MGSPMPGSPPPDAWAGWQSTPAPHPAPDPASGVGVPPVPGAAPGGWQPVPPPTGGWSRPSVGNGNAGIVGGVILVLLGAWFLVDQYIDIDWTLLWPVLVMLAGVCAHRPRGPARPAARLKATNAR